MKISPQILFSILLMAAFSLIAWHPIWEVDVFYLMNLSRAVLRHGSRIIPDPSAFDEFLDPCVTQEWLWGVGAYLIHERFGPEGLCIITILMAALCAGVLILLIKHLDSTKSNSCCMFLSGIAAVCVSGRIKVRPQLAFLIILILFIYITYLYRKSKSRRRIRYGVLIATTVVLWGQLHASFILAPAIFCCTVIPLSLKKLDQSTIIRTDLIVLLLILIGLLTSAAGLDIVTYVISHGASDASRHIREMAPVKWKELPIFTQGPVFALSVLWAISIFGLRRKNATSWSEIGLSLIGIILVSRAARFTSAAGVLTLPLASIGLKTLYSYRRSLWPERPLSWLKVISLASILWLLFQQAMVQAESRGPLFHIGLTEGGHPLAAFAFLKHLSPGSNVLTSYRVGPALSFWSNGRIRTYVDGRTPQYYDDTDYAVAREIFSHEDALMRGLVRFNAKASVVTRDRGECIALSRHWVPVVVEPYHTTFVPPSRFEPLEGIFPCGMYYLDRSYCRNDKLDNSIARLSKILKTPFINYLYAAKAVYCDKNYHRALELLPDDSEAFLYRRLTHELLVRALFGTGKKEQALERMNSYLDAGETNVIQAITTSSNLPVTNQEARYLLEKAVDRLDDKTPPSLRAKLALVCSALGDIECARFHGFRAIARGNMEALPVLSWLAKNHNSPHVRTSAKRWIELTQKLRTRQ